MKEMVGGCCVCSDERGWPDNPLVYCDGNGCTVAVHQACYGIVTVPTGPWFCRKCESPERQAKVRCELCPSRSGALKRADTGGWAHVVCALYIPEVRFGNVTSMEPIILQLIPQERFNKTCYICQEMGRVNRATIGACMQCNKPGCKQQFHVTCAQGLGLLCEEAGNYLDNVKYCGYCQHHYSKLKKGGNVKTIPPYKPIPADSQSSDSSPEKDGDASPPSTSNLVPSATSSSSLKGSATTKMQGSSRKSSGYQSTSSKSAQSNIKTPASTSPSFGSHLPSSTTKSGGTSQGTSPPVAKNNPDTGSTVSTPNTTAVPTLTSSASNVNSSSPAQAQIIQTSSGQKFTSSNFTESVITTSDSVFGVGVPEQKQTKKRKAIAQAASAYPSTSTAPTPQVLSHDVNIPGSSWDSGNKTPSEIIPDSTNDDKVKKVRTDLPSTSSASSSHLAQPSSSHVEMAAPPPPPHYASTIQASPSTSGMSSSSLQYASSHDRSGMSTSNIHYGNIQTPSTSSSSHTQVPTKYSPSVASENVTTRQDTPSLLVSVPLNQGLNLTQQHLANIDPSSSSRSAHPPQHSPKINIPTSTSSISSAVWGLSPMQHDMPSTSGESKHSSSMEKPASVLSSAGTSSSSANTGSSIIRNKKRSAINAPPPNLHSPTSEPIQAAIVKRKTESNPLSQIFSESKSILDSPPSSPGLDRRNLKYNKLEKAPHMLGNELNPDSAVAARLSEQLTAELAAHSVFHASPAPILVPPPLINKASNASSLARSSSSSSGAQSLDQLLERQWEQGSQFLMEQAQHFDIASLLSCLHQLRTENVRLEEHVGNLLQRRDHLLAVNARLAIPLNTVVSGAMDNRSGRDSASNIRSSPVIRTDAASLVTDRPQQLTIREMPPKPS